MRILVTGSTGYIGRRIVDAILRSKQDVSIVALCRDVKKADDLCSDARCRNTSVDDMYRTVADFRPELVLHLATLSTSRDDADIIEPMVAANITFGIKLLDALSAVDSVRLFVNVGSFAEYRNGLGAGQRDAYLYTATKSAFRHFVEYYSAKCGFKYITAVPYSVYGGDDTAKKLMDYMIESIDAAEPVKMTAGEQRLDFVHVDDVVRFFNSTLDILSDDSTYKSLPNGREYHLGTGVATSVRGLASMIEHRSGRHLNIEWGGRPYRPLDVMYACASIEENQDVSLVWHPQISLSDGLDRLIKKYGLAK